VREWREYLERRTGGAWTGDGAARTRSAQQDQVQGLLELAGHLQAILVAVEPAAGFRRRLHGDLLLEAQRLQSTAPAAAGRKRRKGILIGAATVGSLASLAGVIVAVILRFRHGRAAHIA
jgi:hypothetical protein